MYMKSSLQLYEYEFVACISFQRIQTNCFVWCLHKDMDPVGLFLTAYFISKKEMGFLCYTEICSDYYYWEHKEPSVFYVLNFSPWDEAPYKDAAERTLLGGISLNSFLSQVCLLLLLCYFLNCNLCSCFLVLFTVSFRE